MIKEKEEVKIENLVQLQNKVFVADPCFTKEDSTKRYTETLNNVLSGFYEPLVNLDKEHNRIASVILVHTDYLDSYEDQVQNLVNTEIDVESGQCGIYNYDYFMEQERSNDEYNIPTSFYKRACDITVSKDQCGIIDNNGFVTSSGWGDGLYDLYTYTESNGYIVAIELVFINESEGK